MKSFAAPTPDRSDKAVPHRYCEHASARQIRMYMPYADASRIRIRAAQSSGSADLHVSWLYEIPGGWAWTMCRECRRQSRQKA